MPLLCSPLAGKQTCVPCCPCGVLPLQAWTTLWAGPTAACVSCTSCPSCRQRQPLQRGWSWRMICWLPLTSGAFACALPLDADLLLFAPQGLHACSEAVFASAIYNHARVLLEHVLCLRFQAVLVQRLHMCGLHAVLLADLSHRRSHRVLSPAWTCPSTGSSPPSHQGVEAARAAVLTAAAAAAAGMGELGAWVTAAARFPWWRACCSACRSSAGGGLTCPGRGPSCPLLTTTYRLVLWGSAFVKVSGHGRCMQVHVCMSDVLDQDSSLCIPYHALQCKLN